MTLIWAAYSAPGNIVNGPHIVVVSVDGMGSNLYVNPPATAQIPHFQHMMREGSYAEGVEGVYPSLTYPSHTTIVTGQMPDVHGIYTNLSSRQPGKDSGDWFWFAKAIKVPTLWDEARKAHLTTASVFWPVTTDAAIDWDFPEIWDPAEGEVGDPLYVARYTSPKLLIQALLALGPSQAGKDTDLMRTRLAEFLIRKHRPNLLLIHLDTLDRVEHDHGPLSSEAVATLGRIDSRIGEIVEAVKAAGLADTTNFFLLSDHGSMPVTRAVHPNVLLTKAGLLTLNDKGLVAGGKVATVTNGGSMFVYWPEGENLRGAVEAALKPLTDQGLLWCVLDQNALRELGADPDAQMALEAARGVMFGINAGGDLVENLKNPAGTHGYLPFREGLDASFIAWGPGIKAGVNLHRVRMTRIGPTLLKALGIADAKFGSQPPLNSIFKQ